MPTAETTFFSTRVPKGLRTVAISLRVTPEEKDLITRLGKALDRTDSDTLRFLVRTGVANLDLAL